MLKRQKVGIFIFLVLIGIGISMYFTDFLVKSEYNELDVLLLPSILLGLIYTAYKLSKKEESEIWKEYTNKELYYLFCQYFIRGAGIPLMLISISCTFGYPLIKLNCFFDSTSSCKSDLSGYYFFYALLFLIIAYGFDKKLKYDKLDEEARWNQRIKWKDDRIQELGLKLRKLKYTKEKVEDREFLNQNND